MKILYAVPGYKPAYRIGGPVVSVSATAEYLVRRGHSVTVFATNSNLDQDLEVPTNRPVSVNGVEVWYFRRQDRIKKWLPFVPYLAKSIGYLYAPRMQAALNAIVPGVDVVHSHLPFIYPTHAAAYAAFKYKKAFFYHQRGVLDPAHLRFRSVKKRIVLKLIEKPIMQRATCLIGLTEYERRSYVLLGVNTPCEVIPNGIDTREYWHETDPAWHRRIGVEPNATMILFMGRLHPTKGVERLLDAFLRIKDDFPRAVLVLAGPDEFGLQKKVKDAVLTQCEHGRILFTGMVSGDVKKALLARANVFCLPSNAEGLSIAVLEAMASRTAVLLSVGCHFNEVEEQGAGRVCAAEPKAIAECLKEMLNNPEELSKMGWRGYEFVRSQYDWNVVVDKLCSLYQRYIERRNASEGY